MRKQNPYAFEIRAIEEALEDLDSLEPAEAMKLQVRLCELRLDSGIWRREREEIGRKNYHPQPIPAKKRVRERDMTDLRAFRHFLKTKSSHKGFNQNTLKRWNTMANKGQLPRAYEEILINSGYKIKTKRLWNKPKSK